MACEDLTEQRFAEEKLRSAHQQLLDIIDFLPDATFVIDHDNKVIAWNQAIEAMTGVKPRRCWEKMITNTHLPFYGKRRPILIDLVLETIRGD